ncbi:MAG: PucC family protein, partial [Solirubrobacteraceae bacterium]|nr:PucC family protein [Solirubrobacteraceae bacterium]
SDPTQLQPALQVFMLRVAAVVLLLTVVATWGQEPANDSAAGLSRAADREDAISMRAAWSLITSSRQVLVFFAFLLAFTLALFLQDPILESYGAEVFAMPIAATASLSGVWGVGTLLGLLLAGFWLVPRLGKFACARLGCQLILASLLLLVLAGIPARTDLLQLVMFLFGLASGIGTNSTLVLMLDLTLPEAAEAIGITYSRLDRMVRRDEIEVTRFEHSQNRYILADNIDALRGTIAGTNLPSSDASERT